MDTKDSSSAKERRVGQLSLLDGPVVPDGPTTRGAEASLQGEPSARPSPGMRRAHNILRRVFGHQAFRSGQREAISAVVSGRDAVVLLPTGGGKSLCFQVPAVTMARNGQGCTVVVSPLIALMHDQVRALHELGVCAAALNSTLTAGEQRIVNDAFERDELELLYVSPERAAQHGFRQRLARARVALLAVDEAHCVSQWGHDFRPEYMRIHELRRRVDCPVIALTATATQPVLQELVDNLQLDEPLRVEGGFTRANLSFEVQALATDKARISAIDRALRQMPKGRAIIYCSTRKKTQSVAKALSALGWKAGYYHAGRTQLARGRAEAAFASAKKPILVATNAFGMGVDFADVRLLVHFQTPGSVEAYYQEAGRAGRDGEASRCLLFFGKADLVTQRRLSMPKGSSGKAKRRAESALDAMVAYVHTRQCRQQAMSEYFGSATSTEPCGRCDCCRGDATPELAAPSPTSSVTAPEGLADAILAALDDMSKPVGRTNLARALRGSRAKMVRQLKLSQLEHYGAFSGHSEEEVLAALDELLTRDALEVRGRKYPKLWVAGRPLRAPAGNSAAKSSGGRASGGRASGRATGRGRSELARELENYRQRTARRLKWKPYMVFHRKVIVAVDRRRPETLEELAQIPGLGPAKVERFGEEILDLMRRIDA